jgi:hypothetical protein
VREIDARLYWTLLQPGDARSLIEEASGRTLAILGAQKTSYGASPWMLCADDIAKAAKFTLHHVPRWVRAWGGKYGELHNAVDARNLMHHRFIERCGFEWRGEASINGFPFRIFTYVRR